MLRASDQGQRDLYARKHRLRETLNTDLSSELPGRQGNNRPHQNAEPSVLTAKKSIRPLGEASIPALLCFFQVSALGDIYHMSFQIRDTEQHNG